MQRRSLDGIVQVSRMAVGGVVRPSSPARAKLAKLAEPHTAAETTHPCPTNGVCCDSPV
jgi:hypothetical protein